MSNNPNFIPTYSTDNIWRDENMDQCLSDDLDVIESDIAALESGKANTDHTHTGYAAEGHTHTEYASEDHSHTGYAAESHSHSEYASASDLTALQGLVGDESVATQISAAIASKANQDHSHLLADLGVQYGRKTVDCTANTVSTAAVTFAKAYASAPVVTLTAGSSAPGVVAEVTVSNITTTGFTICVYRTNTSVTTIQWIAVGSPT
ncbi:MAG: H-type lectin domain-containing protein [Kiritimatiellae bacterium]|nr:H-type lectin domain-containing protein [Kiritimatiellia bacterium]